LTTSKQNFESFPETFIQTVLTRYPGADSDPREKKQKMEFVPNTILMGTATMEELSSTLANWTGWKL
jgi:hypothetical protein